MILDLINYANEFRYNTIRRKIECEAEFSNFSINTKIQNKKLKNTVLCLKHSLRGEKYKVEEEIDQILTVRGLQSFRVLGYRLINC